MSGDAMVFWGIVAVSVILYFLFGIGFHRLVNMIHNSNRGMAIDIFLWPIGLIVSSFDKDYDRQ